MDRLAVEKNSVLPFPVIAESLPVVGEKNDEGAIVDSPPLQFRDPGPDDLVGARDLSVVREGIAAAVGLRRLIGRVRLEEVEKREERSAVAAVEPSLERGGGLSSSRSSRPSRCTSSS